MEFWLIGYLIYFGFISKEESPWWFYLVVIIFWPAMVGKNLREFVDKKLPNKPIEDLSNTIQFNDEWDD